ncbi:YqeG family HAD IIIA-type phosphatase [Anaerocolumna sedimenticola]|uniref:YqeG family HAD IIIA-type phosphatase n=1 Tax=Anaerocolumna sedimenticola TaxID=2696063 RepID=A0A6P1TKT2_9FIRM|nr:YqeG family HAD IIIA-type phosphatase [Anaerocolumna sedimenticola]QHQ61820.1 YqeG family HAD IIIA-type phosphatase [Anaerocolumna sedimenticola]
MFQEFYPDECADSAYDIHYEALYQQGYRGLLFDIDNTLVEHGADADARSIKLINKLKKIGFNICLISNNSEERVKRFNKDIKVKYIYNAHKPSVKNYMKAMQLMKTNQSNTVFIGDQLFTDVYGAKRAGIKSYFVKPIGPEKEIQIILKRYLERIVLYFYRKKYRYKQVMGNKKR